MGDLTKLKELSVEDYVARWSKYDAAELKDKLTGCSRAAIVGSADGLLHQVNAALLHLQQSLPSDEEAELSEEQEAALDAALTSLKVSAQLCGELLAECHSAPPEALLTAAMQLHDHALLELGDVRPDVQDAVAKLCCSWWTYEADNREFLVSQALPYLLLRAISSGKACQVKACYAMRGALELLDFEDASINDMKRMLLQAAICPAFVSRPDGRKFLSCLLTVHPSMVAEVASVIRNQIPAGRRSVLDAYGEVILRGWREAVGACLPEIENNLIQNLMLAAIHGSSQGLVSNIRRVLGELHRSKKLGGVGSVDGMLVRLYEPILFRALSAANAGVRRNALQLLLDAFPLLDPDASTEEQDEMLVRQFQVMSDALTDPCPLVRVAAAGGICSILNLYWEIIPSATTAGYVSRLTGQLAFDAALPAVRVAVLEGLQLLVDNQHAQPVLKRALPQLSPLMWDSSPRVREAMTDLLLCISTSRGLHFWEVVPLEVLLTQLAAESGGSTTGGGSGTAQKLHQLLVPSYFPGPEEGVARVAALLKEHPPAGQAFCRLLVAPFLHYIEGGKGGHQVQVPLEDILSLASSLAAHLLDHPPVAVGSGGSAGGGDDDDDDGVRSPPRKTRTKRGTGGAGARAGEGAAAAGAAAGGQKGGGRVKRKKAPAPPTDSQPDAEHNKSDAEDAAAAGEPQEVDVMAVGAADESAESWARLLAGLSEMCAGIGMALQHELCSDDDVSGLFPSDALQQLLAACPTPACEACVWGITQALPNTPAARSLLDSQLALLANGTLLLPPPAATTTAAITAAGSSSSMGAEEGVGRQQQQDEARAASVLACLAAGPSGGKLAAMLAAAMDLDWPDSTAVVVAAVPAAGSNALTAAAAAASTPRRDRSRGGGNNSNRRRSGAAAAAGGDADSGGGGGGSGDDVACNACGSSSDGDKLLLCDGCDAALHMSCLAPPIEAIPEHDWLCPECCEEVRRVVGQGVGVGGGSGVATAGAGGGVAGGGRGGRQQQQQRGGVASVVGLGSEAALRYLQLLLGSDSGRALLVRSGLLQQVVPLLQQRAVAAAGAAAAAAMAAASGSGQQQQQQQMKMWGEVAGAMAALLLYARSAVHLLSLGVEEEPTALAQGAASIIHQLAGSCSILKQLNQTASAAAAASTNASAATSTHNSQSQQQQQYMQAVTVSISQLQGLLCDVWAALRLLVVGPQAGFGQSVELSTVAAAAAAAAATAGHSLLLGLAAVGVGLCTEAEDEEEEDGGGGGGWSDLQGDVERCLVLNTHLLRTLVSLTPAITTAQQQTQAQDAQQQQQQRPLREWLLTWVQLLCCCDTPSASASAAQDLSSTAAACAGAVGASKLPASVLGGAVAAAAAQRDLPVLLAALLPSGGVGGSSSRSQQQSTAAAAAAGLVGVGSWLPLVVRAAAEAAGDEEEEEEQEGGEQQEDVDSEGDQQGVSPVTNQRKGRTQHKRAAAAAATAAMTAAAGAGSGSGSRRAGGSGSGSGSSSALQVKAAAGRMGLPALVGALLGAAQQKQVHTQLSRQCLQLAVSAGKQGDWATTLGAVRVGRLLGATADSLTAMSTAAGASNGAGGQQQQQQGGGLVEQLRELRERAMADNGTAAHLFCEALGRLLPQVVSS